MSRAKAQKKHMDEIEAGTNAFLREVDEAMHLDRLQELWNAHKIKLFVAIGVVFASVAGRDIYIDNKETRLSDQAEAYRVIKADDSDPTKKQQLISAIKEEGATGYKLLVEFKQAKDLETAGKTAEAIEIYKTVAANTKLEKPLTDLAKFYQAQATMTTDLDQAYSLFAALDSEKTVYQGSVLEMLGYISENKNDLASALGFYERMLEIQTLTPDMKQRASNRISAINRK